MGISHFEEHGIFLTLGFLKWDFDKFAAFRVIARGRESQVRMPCDNRDHEHPRWPMEGAVQFVIEACETQCGWCMYETKNANNLRVVGSFLS